ncbi:MAG: TetR family transcriptional regulator [Streptosporangiales bacterium]|nr:TetR family transcriptional regulator [Streptosporangiales bacterium]
MPTPAERGEEVRRRLLAAAAELIAEHGWSAVRTRMLAERAGVAGGLVHYHFSSVRELLTKAATGAMREVAASLGPTLARARTPKEAVESLAASLDAFTGTDPVSVLFLETYLASLRDPELRAEVAEIITDFRTRLAAWLGEHGVEEPEVTAAVLASAIDGLVMQRALDPAVTGTAVTPVLVRMLTPATEREE